MKSTGRLRLNVVKRLLVLSVLMLVSLQNLMAQSVTQLPTEKKDSESAARELTIEEVMQIAEEEIERTAQEAVKAALLETGGELAFEKERADQLEKAKTALEIENKKTKFDVEKDPKYISLKEENEINYFGIIMTITALWKMTFPPATAVS